MLHLLQCAEARTGQGNASSPPEMLFGKIDLLRRLERSDYAADEG